MGQNWLFEPKRWETASRSQLKGSEKMTNTKKRELDTTGSSCRKRQTCRIKLEHEYDVYDLIPENVIAISTSKK